MIQGGGTSSHKGIKLYILFAGRGFETQKVLNIVEKFKGIHMNTAEHIGGEIIDIDSDDRLKNSLYKSNEGKTLYDEIADSEPALCFSSSYIGDIRNTDKVRILPVRNYRDDFVKMFDIINDEINFHKEKRSWIEFLKMINEVVILQPNIAGIGVDFNNAISSYINRIEKSL